MLTLLIVLLVLAFVAGSPLFAVMLFITAIGAMTGDASHTFHENFSGYVYEFFSLGTGDKSTIFSSIPLFIYAGYIMAASKTAERLVRFANAALGWVPGGLGIVTILACSVYTTFTGASGVTIVALGGLLMPALIKQRYPERFALGLVTGTGSVGLLFPPALPIILFGTIYGLQQIKPTPEHWQWEWATERFYFAGIVPGIVLISMLSALVITIAIIKKVPRQKFEVKEFFASIPGALPVILLPLMILGFLASGKGDISQVAAVTVLYLLIVEMGIFRDLKPRMLWAITRESMALIGAIFIIIYSATALTNYLVTAQIPAKLVEWTTEHIHQRWAFLLALNVLLLAAGMVMDIFSAILIVVPLIAPVAHAYDISPYHLGVIFLLNLEIGYLHPPIGLNLFISSFKFRKPLLEVTVATLPFMLTVLASLLVVTYVPSLTVVPPPKPLNTLDSLVSVVKASSQAVINVNEVTLPDGTVKKQQDCGAIENEFDRDNCLGLFTDVTNCRRKPPAEVEECKELAAGADPAECRRACETAILKEWAEENGGGGDDGGSFEDDDEGTEDEGGGGGFEDDADDEEGAGDGSAAEPAAGSGSGSGSGAGSGSL
jgi:tripartite ATP-independent transporter DctM subunit